MLPIVWSSLCIVKVAACGTLVSFSCEILQRPIFQELAAMYIQGQLQRLLTFGDPPEPQTSRNDLEHS